MPESSLQKISHILFSSKNISASTPKPLTFSKDLRKEINNDAIKTKLQTCLFGLKQVNQKFRKGLFDVHESQKHELTEQNSKQMRFLDCNSELPSILRETEKIKTMSKNKVFRQNHSSPNQQIERSSSPSRLYNCMDSRVNESVLRERLNQTLWNYKDKDSSAVMNLSKTSQSMLPRMSKQKIMFENSSPNRVQASSIVQSSQLKQNTVSKTESHKKINIHPRVKKHLYESATGKALSKENRYFSDNPPLISSEEVAKIGLYESVNRFRKECLVREMDGLSPKVEKKQIEQVKVCRQNELFLTRPKELQPAALEQFLKEQFVINEAKPKRYFETVKTEEIEARNEQQKQYVSQEKIGQSQPNQCDPIAQPEDNPIEEKSLVFLEIKNFQIVKNESYLKFRVMHIEIWDEIQALFQQLARFLRELKIHSCRFKANNLLGFWSGKKLSVKDMEGILNICKKDVTNRQLSAMESILRILHAKKKMNAIVSSRQRRMSYMKWVCDRIIGIRSIKRETQYKINKAYELHESLLQGEYPWDVQIYISSFSEHSFVRNTTQYMESFENMFTHMWKESSKHMILVIPTVNSEILQMYQEKLKIKRTVTLICPEVHELFPVNMSLAGCLLFSYQALNKIKSLIEGKRAVIIPGKFSSPKYELLISEFLRTPLLTSLKPPRDLMFQKQLFQSANLSVLPYISIKAQTGMEDIIRSFAELILCHRQINKWVFKINGEFSGRGLATFCINSSKVLRSILASCKDTRQPLEDYLKRNLKLKLKINYENSLFMLGDYLERLSEKGGVIQEQKEQVESYEVGFFVESKLSCEVVDCFKCFSVNHSNKAYIYEQSVTPKIASILSKLKKTLQSNEYLGYVSVNMVVSNDKVFGIEIKPYMTHLSSIEPFIKSIESRRQLKLNLQGQETLQGHEKMENEMISSTLRNEFLSRRKLQFTQNNSINVRESEKVNENSHLFSNINLSITELQTIRPANQSEFTYLFIPNIILTDVPTVRKAEFIQGLVEESFSRSKFSILENNLVLYLSNGLGLSLLVIGKEMKKMKKISVEVVRFLSQKSGALKIYCGKNQARDVFQFGDIIKAITQIKA